MLLGLGWSASDIVLAVQVITKVGTAFRDAGGAEEQYASTAAFLDVFARTLQRINSYTESISLATDGKALSADMASQMKLVYAEYVKFDNYLKKVEPGLSSVNFSSRIVARARWAVKETNAKVDNLRKSVTTPMMFVAPLLAVETLSELGDIKSRLPNAVLQEDSLRENRIMLVKINNDLAYLKDNLDSYWLTRRWAMSAVEDDIKSLTLAVKNNSAIASTKVDDIQDQIAHESAKARQEQAAANLTTISTVETVMDSRLAYVESRIDILISEHRSKTGKEDQELHALRTRIATSRQHLHVAALSARKALKHFGLLVLAVNHMHRNPLTTWMLPLAGGILGYDRIFEHGENMVKSAGQTVVSSGKYIEESDLMKSLKSWRNPFTVAVGKEKARVGGRESPAETGHGKSFMPSSSPSSSPSPSLSPTPPVVSTPTAFTSTRSPVLDCTSLRSISTPPVSKKADSHLDVDEDDDFGQFESVSISTPTRPNLESWTNTHTSSLSGSTLTPTSLAAHTASVDLLLLLDEESSVGTETVEPNILIPADKTAESHVLVKQLEYVDDNPWA